ncbi:MAG: hypothetical protein C4340_03520 [Armatimonadota bacterium]
MTHRERLVAAARGGPMDRPPWFVWDAGNAAALLANHAPDAVVASSPEEAKQLLGSTGEEGPAVLVEVLNPLGLALHEGDNPNRLLDKPDAATRELDRWVERCREALSLALESGADGVLYRLRGAEPPHSTPMEFGGYHLERERALLEEIRDARFNVLLADGGKDTYIDFLTDLPAHAFAWDDNKLPYTARQVREMRPGALACGLYGDLSKTWNDLQGVGVVFAGPARERFDYSEVEVKIAEIEKALRP